MNITLETLYSCFDPATLDALVGSMLGDGRLNFTSFASANAYFEQSLAHKPYLLALFAALVALKPSPIKDRAHKPAASGALRFSSYFYVPASAALGLLASHFYLPLNAAGGFVKCVPWHLMPQVLTPGVLAYWLCDDGQYVMRGGVTLCTDNFSFGDVLTLVLVLEMHYGVVCTLHTKHRKDGSKARRIYISKGSLPLLRSLVGHLVHHSMQYKLED